MTNDPSIVSIYAIAEKVTTLGPGIRLGIWFQGCPFTCSGCIAADSQAAEGGQSYPLTDLVDLVAETSLDGVTISGGEPFAQPYALSCLLAVANKNELSTIVFSGYRLKQLVRMAKNNCSIARCLRQIDVLIDGTYDSRRQSHEGLFGSTNQEVHFLTDRHVSDAGSFYQHDKSRFQIVDTKQGSMIAGVPSPDTEKIWRILTSVRGKT